MKKIVHIITGLNNGGAEMMLYKLLKYTDKSRFECCVISLLDEGIMGPKIKELGIPVISMNMRNKLSFKAIIESIRLCENQDIIQTWMYHANFFGMISNVFCKKRLIWGIRRGYLDKSIDKKSTIMISYLCGMFSKHVDTIVYCSENSLKYHLDTGYNSINQLVIPNGFELEQFYRRDSKKKIYEELKISMDQKTLLLVARWSPVKGHKELLESVNILRKSYDDFVVIMCGTGIDSNNNELRQIIKQYNLDEKVYLLGRRDDIPDLMSAVDIYVSPSSIEGFSNVIGEAMSCETPCIVTDVGDSKLIVGDTGVVVQDNKPTNLAEGIEKLLNLSQEELRILGKKARQRIINNYDIKGIVKKYEELYLSEV